MKEKETKYAKFKKKHPKLHIANSAMSLLLPVCILVVCLLIFPPIKGREILAVYSGVGSIALGVGLLLCVLAEYTLYAFFKCTIYPVIIGFFMAVGNALCACNEKLGAGFEENELFYQLTCYISLIFTLILYFTIIRETITDLIYRKTKLTENQMDDKKEGFLNSLFYCKIHREYKIGFIYYFNALYVFLSFAFLVGAYIIPLYTEIARLLLPLGLATLFLTLAFNLFAIVMSVKNKKSYWKTGGEKGIRAIPYFAEIGSILLLGLFALLQLETYFKL